MQCRLLICIPGLLLFRERDPVARIEFVKIVEQPGRNRKILFRNVFRILPPREKMEAEFLHSEFSAGEFDCLRLLDNLIKIPAVPHCSGFNENETSGMNGGERASFNLPGLARLLRTDWTVL